MTLRLLLLVLLASVATAHAQDWDEEDIDPQAAAQMQAQAEAHRLHAQRVAQALAATGHARELALAALLRRSTSVATEGGVPPPGDAPSRRTAGDAQADAWLRAAAAKAGSDVLANQLVAAAAEDGPLRREAAQRWQAAEPGNLVPLLSMDLPADALLADARRAEDADVHLYAGVRWTRAALARHPPTVAEQRVLAGGEQAFLVDEAATLFATALWNASAMPTYHALAQACRGTALRASPARAADCRHVATVLADRSDNLLGARVGLSMLAEVADRGPERAGVEARQRRMDWQMQQWGRLASQQPRDGAAQFMQLLEDPAVRTERDLLERVLRAGGVSPEPPPGWRPPRD